MGNVGGTDPLRCLTERGGITDAVPVANWLFSQMNLNGGFASTSDTYAGNETIRFRLQTFNSNFIFQFSGQPKLLDQISFELNQQWMVQSFHLKLLGMKESLVKFNGTKIVSIMFFRNLRRWMATTLHTKTKIAPINLTTCS